jgi:hypothetical protein
MIIAPNLAARRLRIEDTAGRAHPPHPAHPDLRREGVDTDCVWFSEAAAVLSGTFSVTRLVNVSGAKRRLEAVCAAAGQPSSTATL